MHTKVGIPYVFNEEYVENEQEVVAENNTGEYLRRHQPLSPITLVSQAVSFADGSGAEFRVASGFSITVAAENLGKARFMTKSPDGRIFVPDMVDYQLSHEGRLLILDDFDAIAGRFETKTEYRTGLRGPHNVQFYTDVDGKTWLYLTLTEHLIRYPYEAGDTEPRGSPEIVLEFPNRQSDTAVGAVWHITRTVLFVEDTMYVSVGSGCNVCEEAEDEIRAMIIAANPDGSNVRRVAEGIKNAVGLEWAHGALYATENGSDHLGDDAPNDTAFRITEGSHYGWPYCYDLHGEKVADLTQEWKRVPVSCDEVPRAFAVFEPHAAPLGITYVVHAHPVLDNSFLVALQGSWQVEVGTGYQVVRVSLTGETDVFVDGFLSEDYERIGRPVHVLQWDEQSFFVTDDWNGRMFYVVAR